MMRQLPLPLPYDAAMGPDDFLVTPCNAEAAAWIEKWPEWPAHGLILSGLAGSGKTHLLNLWIEKTGGMIVNGNDLAVKDFLSLNSAPALGVDNVDACAGNYDAEANLFHLFNAVKERNIKTKTATLMLTTSKNLAQAGFSLPDLRSRLLSLPVATLLPPDDALLEALVVKQFRDRQVMLDAGVVSYLASRMPRDAEGIRALVERLDLAGLAEGRKITIALARKILESSGEVF